MTACLISIFFLILTREASYWVEMYLPLTRDVSTVKKFIDPLIVIVNCLQFNPYQQRHGLKYVLLFKVHDNSWNDDCYILYLNLRISNILLHYCAFMHNLVDIFRAQRVSLLVVLPAISLCLVQNLSQLYVEPFISNNTQYYLC